MNKRQEMHRVAGANVQSHALASIGTLLVRSASGLLVGLSLTLSACSPSPDALLEKAKESIAKEDLKSAELNLKSVLQQQDNPEARYLLGTVYFSNRDNLSAEKEFRRAIDAGMDRGKVSPMLAEALLRIGKYKEAIEEGSKASPGKADDQAKLLTAVGRAQLSLGRNDAARTSLNAALTARPEYVPAKITLISMRAVGGDVKGAADELEAVLAANPSDPQVLAFKADIELSQGRREEGKAFLQKVIAADPKDQANRAKLITVALALKDYPLAQRELDDLVKIGGNGPITLQLQAQIDVQQGKMEKARDAIQASLKQAPDYLPSVALGAQIYLSLNANEQALRLAQQLHERAPNSILGYRLLAAAYLRGNDPTKAAELLQGPLSQGSKDPMILNLAGEAALRRNDLAKAVGYFEAATKADPTNPTQVTGLAMAHLARGDKDRGLAELEQAAAMGGTDTRADMTLIATLAREKQYDKALAAIDRLEKRQPQSALPATLRASILTAKNDIPGARRAYETALEREPRNIAAVSGLAALDLREKKPDEAKKRYQALLDRDPKNVMAMLALAQLAQGTADSTRADVAAVNARAGKSAADDSKRESRASKDALEWLKKAREVDKDSAQVAIALANWNMLNGTPKDAIPVLQEALTATPDDIRLLDALGTLYLRTQQPDQAIDQFEKILRKQPNSAALQYRMGQLKATRGDIEGAQVNLRRAIELQPDAAEPRAALAGALVRAAKYSDARTVTTQLQKDFPKNAVGAILDGEISMAERKFPDAVASYRKALAIDRNVGTQMRLQQAVFATGNTTEADSLMKALVREHPDDLQVRLRAGDYALLRKQWPEAIEQFKAIAAKQPQNAIALNNLAWAMHEAKDANALPTAEKALAAAPGSAAIMDTLGVILIDRGQSERGVKLLRQAVGAEPKAAMLRLHLVEALIRTGDKDGARAELANILKDDPKGDIAERAAALQKRL